MRRTIRFCQENQPWTVPYSNEFLSAQAEMLHLYGSHAALHAAKTAGKLAAIFEGLDHGMLWRPETQNSIGDMAADLMTVALRFANLYNFDLETVLVERADEKNGKTYPIQPAPESTLSEADLKQALFLAMTELRVWWASKVSQDGAIENGRWSTIDLVADLVPVVLRKLKGE